MAQIKTYSMSGEEMGETEAQICIQHGYGDGLEQSCELTVQAVQGLLYDIPIDGYISVYYDAIALTNHALGGVELTPLYDILYSETVQLHAGETKTLSDEEAYIYVRYRDISQFNSATERLNRDVQFMEACYQKFLISDEKSAIIKSVYEAVEDYVCADVNIVELALSVMSYDFSSDYIYELPGEQTMGEHFVEYRLDEEGCRNIIYQVYYKKLNE